jgi:ABC-type phosphate/phosphonate transport system substrate-binding protein
MLFTLFLASCLGADAAELHIGVHKDLFGGMNESELEKSLDSFKDAVAERIHKPVTIELVKDPHALCEHLSGGRFDFAILSSPHVIWECSRFKELRPLVVAVGQRVYPQTLVIRHQKDIPLEGVTTGCAVPVRPHVTFFRTELDVPPPRRFPTTEELLDDVVDGKITLGLVDGSAWDAYCRRKPDRAQRFLKIVQESPRFLPTTVLVREGALTPATLQSYKESLLDMNQDARGRQTLMVWRLSAFQEVPKDYERQAQALLKRYPRKD